MTLSTDTAIERLAHRLLDRSLPKSEWTHEAHFAAALWMIRWRPEFTAPDAFKEIITSYNETTGTVNSDTSGYHHTITVASLRAVRDFERSRGPNTPLKDVLNALMASPLGRPDWLLKHWRRETLFSVAARRGWIQPDLSPLPF